MQRYFFVLMVLACLGMMGCPSAQRHRADVRNDTGDRISAGTVQREIRVGMSGSDVVSILGAPNMVTTDEQRRETWVYDKIATERVYSSSDVSGGGAGLASDRGASSGGLLGLIFGGSSSAGASSTSQRTLTVVIKFDNKGLVRDYSYRQSSF
jgi:outer membrane protein assembly factor BamE (lipoprotein component of BamABCDE complex)